MELLLMTKPLPVPNIDSVLVSFSGCRCGFCHLVLGCTASGLKPGLEAGRGSGSGKELDNGGVLETLEMLGSKGVLGSGAILSPGQAAC